MKLSKQLELLKELEEINESIEECIDELLQRDIPDENIKINLKYLANLFSSHSRIINDNFCINR
jgi:hypothetical protein